MATSQTIAPLLEPAQAELDYVSGIERLNDPAPVRLVVGEIGIEIIETMPGTRKILIEAASVIDAKVTDGGEIAGESASRNAWWRNIFGDAFNKPRNARIPVAENRNYILTIRYQEDNQLRTAVFHRRGSTGLLMIQGLARAVASLVWRRSQDSSESIKQV